MSDSATIRFVNTTLTHVEIIRGKHSKRMPLHSKYLVPPYSSFSIRCMVGDEWIAQVTRNDCVYTLGTYIKKSTAESIPITDENLKSHHKLSTKQNSSPTVEYSNRASFPIDLYYIQPDGSEKFYKEVPSNNAPSNSSKVLIPGDPRCWYSIYPHGIKKEKIGLLNPGSKMVYFDPSWTGQNVLAGQKHLGYGDSPKQYYPLGSTANRITQNEISQIRFDNLTTMTVDVFQTPEWANQEVKIATISAKDYFVFNTIVTDPLIVRDSQSKTLLYVTKVTRGNQAIEIKDEHIHSSYLGKGSGCQATWNINTDYPVECFWVNYSGKEEKMPVVPKDVYRLTTNKGHVFKFKPKGIDQTIGLFVVTEDQNQSFSLENHLYRESFCKSFESGKEIDLRPGEMALFEKENYQGKAWIFHSTIPDLNLFAELNNTISSIRLGHNTVSSSHAGANFSGDSIELLVDTPKLSEKGFDNKISSIRLNRMVDTQELGITSRSACTFDYFWNSKTQCHEKVPVLRSTVSFPSMVHNVEIWAAEPITLQINDREFKIDPVRSAQVHPDFARKLILAVKADYNLQHFGVPALIIRTNTMHVKDRFFIYPDVEAHKNLLKLKQGALKSKENRIKLGVKKEISDADLDAVQETIQAISSTMQHTYNFSEHGVHHDRVIEPDNLSHPHRLLEFKASASKDHVSRPLTSAEVERLVKGAKRITLKPGSADVGADFLDFLSSIGHKVSDLTHVVIHTVETVAVDAVETVVHVGEDVVNTVSNVAQDSIKLVEDVGEDLVRGDFVNAWSDLRHDVKAVGDNLRSGGEQVFGDITSGVGSMAGDTLSGIGKAIHITLKIGGQLFQFVLDHTGIVGQLIKLILKKIDVAVHKLVELVMDITGWGDVMQAKNALKETFLKQYQKIDGELEKVKQSGDQLFKNLEKDFDKQLHMASAHIKNPLDPQHSVEASNKEEHSKARELIEWLLSKVIMRFLPGGGSNPLLALANSVNPLMDNSKSPVDEFNEMMDQAFSMENPKFKKTFHTISEYMEDTVNHPLNLPKDFASSTVLLAKNTGDGGIEMANTVFDNMIDVVTGSEKSLLNLANKKIHIPLISDILGGDSWSVLDVVALFIAIPSTYAAKSDGVSLFTSSQNTVAQNQSNDVIRAWGYYYGGAHLIMALISSVTITVKFIRKRTEIETKDRLNREFQIKTLNGLSTSQMSKVETQLPVLDGKADLIDLADGFSLLVESIALFAGSPVGTPDPRDVSELFRPLDSNDRNDPLKAASYWSHVIWRLQFAMWLYKIVCTIHNEVKPVSLLFTKKVASSKYFLEGFDSKVAFGTDLIYAVFGVVHIAFFGILSNWEKKRFEAINALPTSERRDETGFLSWGQRDGYSLKAVGNINEGVAEILTTTLATPVIVESSEGWSLPAAFASDIICHTTQGVIYLTRTGNDDLY